MLFNSLQFLLFFPVVTILYFVLPFRFRWFMLLAASCWFYMAFVPWYILILAFTIVVDYFAGIAIEQAVGKQKKILLITGLLANVLVLAFFKYYNFMNANLEALAGFLHWNYPIGYLEIILPIGLSFHTFQAMSYILEVYRGRQKAERHFGIFSLYVMFYPQLVAGPIERPQNLLHQFRENHTFDYQRVTEGLRLMGWGLFKKMVIADRLSLIVTDVFNTPGDYHGMAVILSSFLFAFQIYADFSGYSDIAIGAAKVMGFKLMQNFNLPYFSKSIQDFWHRWHMSLSTWFRDYLFLPIAYQVNRRWKKARYFGLRTEKWIYIYATAVTMLLCGLWHGANWTFVIWGALHAMYLSVEFLLKRKKRKSKQVWIRILKNTARSLLVFMLVSFSWIFFRANSVGDAGILIHNIFTTHSTWWDLDFLYHIQGWRNSLYLLLLLVILEGFQSRTSLLTWINTRAVWQRWIVYIGFVWIILSFGHFGKQEFIYFQF